MTDDGFELLPQAPRRISGRLLTSMAAVAVLAAGGAATYIAFAAGHSGAGTPKAAVQKVIGDLNHSDLVGLLDDIAPGERNALAAPVRADIASLKRLGVLSGSANPAAVSGVHFAAKDLKYADKTIKVNDHVQIVQITGGSVDVSGDTTKLPLTQRFVDAAKVRPQQSGHTIPIDHPIRIATEKVGDTWYASLFYTIADNATHHVVPTAADAIPASGAGSGEAAVRKLIRAMTAGDYRSALALLSPDELGVLHDYGGLLVKKPQHPSSSGLSIRTLELTSTPIDHGARIGLKRLVAQVRGMQVSVTQANGCYRLDAGPVHENLCPSNAADLMSAELGRIKCALSFRFGSGPLAGSRAQHPFARCIGPQFTSTQKSALTDLVTGLTKDGGIDTVQVGGQWYVAPVRTLAERSSSLLSALHGDDLFVLASLGD